MKSGLCRTSFEISKPHHDLLHDYLNIFSTAYIDNILVFSDSLKEQIEHVELVLVRRHERGFQADIDECAFGETKLRYVCLIIAMQGIWIYQERLSGVADREIPSCVKDVQGL